MDQDAFGNTIFQRTAKGQKVATARKSLMEAHVLSLLRLVNGFTPTEILIRVSGVDAEAAKATLLHLEAIGLITAVGPDAP
jgi:hypothetical protein